MFLRVCLHYSSNVPTSSGVSRPEKQGSSRPLLFHSGQTEQRLFKPQVAGQAWGDSRRAARFNHLGDRERRVIESDAPYLPDGLCPTGDHVCQAEGASGRAAIQTAVLQSR